MNLQPKPPQWATLREAQGQAGLGSDDFKMTTENSPRTPATPGFLRDGRQ